MTLLRRTSALFLIFLAGLAWAGAQEADGAAADGPRVLVMTLDGGVVQPVIAEFAAEVLETAAAEEVEAVIFELSTPGGMLDSTRRIWQEMLESPVPVVVWVTPSGAQAASAGFFLLMAGDVAAMAPGTNTGAAHPVAGGGGDIEGDLGKKIEEDSAAAIRSLAGRNGRDLKLAESAVLESRSFTAQEAIDLGLADLVASDLPALLEKLDGLEVRTGTPEARRLETAGATVMRAEMTPFQRVRSTLAHPEIAVLLMSLGSAGLLIELQNPGLLFPGVLGAIALILGFYGASILPLNYAGLALMGLAVVLLIAEISVQSFGILGLGGLLSFVLGSLMLFRSADPALRVSTGFIVTLAVAGAVLIAGLSWLAFRARSSAVATGSSGMLAEAATAVAGFAPAAAGYEGKVQVHGELWRARSKAAIGEGEQVVVTGVDGLTLDVSREADVAGDAAER